MKIRWKLKKHDVNAEDVMSVYSVEKPVCELLPLDEEQRQAPQVPVCAHAPVPCALKLTPGFTVLHHRLFQAFHVLRIHTLAQCHL
jgi:hypothetical protein